MKIHPECIPCLFERAKFECDLAFGEDKGGKLKALVEVAKYAAEEIDKNTVPALIGTKRGRIISEVSGVLDPYHELKLESNRAGDEVLQMAIEYCDQANDKLYSLMMVAAAANSMEYGVRGHRFDEKKFRGEFTTILEENVAGDINGAKEALKKYSKILYLLDNAGEVIIDKLVLDELLKMGKEVVVSPKSEPVINDITSAELRDLGFEGYSVLPSGAFVGVSLEEASREFLNALFDPEYLIIAKGMGNYETLSEFEDKLKGRLIYIFRAKCFSVADSVGVKKGTLVITFV
jgi:uncharacterized protein with ATP-grasp and redox domains